MCFAVASLRRSRREDDASAAWRLRERQTAAAAAYGVRLESIRIYHRTAAQNQNPAPLAAKDPNRERGLEDPSAPTFFEVLMPGGERAVGKTSPRKGASFDAAETFADAFRTDAEGFEPSRGGAGNDAEESSGESSSRGAERALEALWEAEKKAARENDARENDAGRRARDPEPPGGVPGAREREVPIGDAAAEEEGGPAASPDSGSGSSEDAASVLLVDGCSSSGSSDKASALVERDGERERARRDASRRRRIFQDASAPRREDSGRAEWTMAVEQANAEASAAEEAEGAGERREGARDEERW